MLLLTSGRYVDIATNRAKYHALQRHGPAPDTEHRALYALADIIYRFCDKDGNPRHGWTEYDYAFYGYTLADIQRASDWSDTVKPDTLDSCRRSGAAMMWKFPNH